MDALSNGTASNGCSDCALGVVSRQLNSPFGYHPDFANDFRSKTSECGATGYTFTSPAPYAISTKPNTSPTDIPTCVSPYTVQAGDTCDAIAVARGVSTHSVVKAGGTDPDCTTLQVGVKLCLPEPCKLYRVQYDDTCERILASVTGLQAHDLLTWNPNINPLCTNLGSMAKKLICIRQVRVYPPDQVYKLIALWTEWLTVGLLLQSPWQDFRRSYQDNDPASNHYATS